jgi:hypothetical protein
VHVTIDQAGNHSPPFQISVDNAESRRQRGNILPDPGDGLARYQKVGSAFRLRIVQVGIAQQIHRTPC